MAKHIDYWAVLRPGLCYHIYNHAVGSENLFREVDNYRFFIERFNYYFEEYVQLYAYCLMPNHFHLLLQLKEITPAIESNMRQEANQAAHAYLEGTGAIRTFYETQFRRFFTSYSRAYGKKYNRTGSLFQAKFKRTIIHNEMQFWNKLCYIHHNPIHHGFSKDYESWPYQSYKFYLQKDTSTVNTDAVLRRLGDSLSEQRSQFAQMHINYQKDIQSYYLIP